MRHMNFYISDNWDMQIPIRLGNTGTNVPHWIAIWIYTNSCFTEPDKTFLNKAVQVNAIDFTLY